VLRADEVFAGSLETGVLARAVDVFFATTLELNGIRVRSVMFVVCVIGPSPFRFSNLSAMAVTRNSASCVAALRRAALATPSTEVLFDTLRASCFVVPPESSARGMVVLVRLLMVRGGVALVVVCLLSKSVLVVTASLWRGAGSVFLLLGVTRSCAASFDASSVTQSSFHAMQNAGATDCATIGEACHA